MAFVTITEPVVGEPVKASFGKDVVDNLNDLNARTALIEGQSVRNGSFEFDNDGDLSPDAWTITEAGTGGGSFALETTVIDDGAQSLKLVSTALGGFRQCQSDDFIPVTGGIDAVFVKGSVRQSVLAAVSGNVLFYNAAESLIATVAFMSETALPLVDTWYPIRGHADVPSGARFYKIVFFGGDGTVATDTFWDGMATGTSPFDWVWDPVTHVSATTHAVTAVGYPKYVLVSNVFASLLGWDPATSAFTSNRAWQDSVATEIGEISLDPTGQFQTSVAATPDQKAYR